MDFIHFVGGSVPRRSFTLPCSPQCAPPLPAFCLFNNTYTVIMLVNPSSFIGLIYSKHSMLHVKSTQDHISTGVQTGLQATIISQRGYVYICIIFGSLLAATYQRNMILVFLRLADIAKGNGSKTHPSCCKRQDFLLCMAE